jgi:hypothetical protein
MKEVRMTPSSPHFPFHLGQPVRRIDGSDRGVVIGALLTPAERAIVRWAADTTYEDPADLIEVDQAA